VRGVPSFFERKIMNIYSSGSLIYEVFNPKLNFGKCKYCGSKITKTTGCEKCGAEIDENYTQFRSGIPIVIYEDETFIDKPVEKISLVARIFRNKLWN